MIAAAPPRAQPTILSTAAEGRRWYRLAHGMLAAESEQGVGSVRLEGKAAIVTGSATGVGRSTAVMLAERGCDVVVNYTRSETEARETARAVEQAGTRALLQQCDVSDDRAVRAMVAACQRELGRLDVLVNNAGTTHFVPFSDLDALTDEIWERIFAVNVRGAFNVTRAAAPLMRAAGGGAVVNVASLAGLRASGSSIPYAASKAALLNMTVALARTLAPEIRVNAVAPGFIEGRWLQGGLGERYEGSLAAVATRTPLGRVARPEDVAQAILALVESADFVTGQTIAVDGGNHIAI